MVCAGRVGARSQGRRKPTIIPASCVGPLEPLFGFRAFCGWALGRAFKGGGAGAVGWRRACGCPIPPTSLACAPKTGDAPRFSRPCCAGAGLSGCGVPAARVLPAGLSGLFGGPSRASRKIASVLRSGVARGQKVGNIWRNRCTPPAFRTARAPSSRHNSVVLPWAFGLNY